MERIGAAEARNRRQPISEAAVEEDHDQGDDRDPLDRLDLDGVVHAGPDVGDGRGGDQEDRRRRHRNALGQRRREHGEREADSDDEDDAGEVGDLGHG